MFLFKQKSQDFIVEEQLPFELSWHWDAFYVYIEKRNKNTADILQHLCSKFKISRKTIGIAGLKDKKAIARQWISIYKRALGQLGGEKVWVEALKEVCTIKDVQWHSTPLNMSTWISNRFHIRLRAEKNLSEKERENTKEILEKLLSKGYSNVFGSQRFGIEWRNKDQWKEILLWTSKLIKIKHPDRKEVIFKLQAYASFLFNSYYYERGKTKLKLIDWDIIELDQSVEGMKYGSWIAETNTVTLFDNKHGINAFKHPKRVGKNIPYDSKTMHLTGPIPGQDLLLPTPTTDAWRKEHEFLKSYDLTEKDIAVFSARKVFWLRRRMRVQPTKTSVRLQWDDVLIDFTLPAGSYASTLIDRMKHHLAIKDAHGGGKFKKSHKEDKRPKRPTRK